MFLPSPVVAAGADHSTRRPAYEVADVVRAYGAAFLRTHPTAHAPRRVLRAIARCRTALLGGHVEGCDRCGSRRIAYNSCGNRHCPKCLAAHAARWLAAEQALLLPVSYFHVVFTLPHELNALVRVNRRRLYALLFRAAAATLRTFALNPRHLGAELGVTAVRHTWGQNLSQHIHVHCVVTGGGLSADGQCWVNARSGFLFPVRALSKVFRGKFLAGLRQLRARGLLHFAGDSAALADEHRWAEWLRVVSATDWVVYAKPPFGGPERVLKYLGRYTHRIAISNQRIVSIADGVVRFRWKDYAQSSVRLLLDECVPKRLRRELPGHEVRTAPEMGWAGKENGALLAVAESKFDVLITVDQKLKHQQSMAGRNIAVVVLAARRNKIELLALPPDAPEKRRRPGEAWRSA